MQETDGLDIIKEVKPLVFVYFHSDVLAIQITVIAALRWS